MKVFVMVLLLWDILYAEAYPVTMSTGVYFEKINNVYVYQKTIPIIYTTIINVENNFKTIQTYVKAAYAYEMKYNVSKPIMQNIYDLLRLTKASHNDTVNLIADFKYETATLRPKRGLKFLGEALKWCCTTLIEEDGNKLLTNERTLKHNYDELKDALIDEHKDILSFSKDVQISIQDIHSLMNLLDTKLSEIHTEVDNKFSPIEQRQRTFDLYIHISTIMFNYLVEYHKISSVLQSCKNHQLPSILVSQDILKNDLTKLEKTASKLNQELTLPISNLIPYYHLKLINCHIINNQLEVELKVPLKIKKTEFQLYEYTPLKFRSHDFQLCEWAQDTATLIFEVNTQAVYTLMGKDLQECNPQKHLCKVPQTRTSNQVPQCARSLFLEKQLNEILKTCVFQCEPNHKELIVKQIGPEKFALTNAMSNLSVYDILQNTFTPLDLNTSLPGTLLITLSCTLELHQSISPNETQIIIPSGFPCLKDYKKPLAIVHHLPVLWTEMAVNDVGYRLDSDVAAVGIRWKEYNTNWTSIVPHFSPISSNSEFTKRLHDIELKLPDFDENDTINFIHFVIIIWCGLLTLIVIILLYFLMKNHLNAPFLATQEHIESLFDTKIRENLELNARSSFHKNRN